jgi:hypothetical protein
MDTGETIFARLMGFLSVYEFQKCVQPYNGYCKVKDFSCWSQLLCMAFAQLTCRESLRDIEACLQSTAGPQENGFDIVVKIVVLKEKNISGFRWLRTERGTS